MTDRRTASYHLGPSLSPEGVIIVRHRRRILSVVTLLVSIAALLAGASGIQLAQATSASGLDGAGFQNVVAVDPHGTGVVISGSDIGGFQVGSGSGAVFASRNAAAQRLADMTVASVVFATQTTMVYAGTGKGEAAQSGFWSSSDGGQTWTRLGEGEVIPDFDGGGVGGVNFRSTGRLLALDESTNPDGHPANIYAATTTGVMRSQDGGHTWSIVGLNDVTRYLRGVALDPTDQATLYVASYEDGVWVSHNANAPDPADVAFTRISGLTVPGSPVYPEELVVLADQAGPSLYASAAGISPSDPNGGGVYEYRDGTWTFLTAGLASSANWFAIDGYVEEGVAHLVAGCRDGCPVDPDTGLSQNLYRSDDGGASWRPLLVDRAAIHSNQVGGPGGASWWLAQATPDNMLGGAWYQVAQVAIDPSNNQRIFVAGRSGLWRSEDGGTNWYPCVKGMLVTVGFDVAVDPTNPSKVYTALADWGMVWSHDRGTTVTRSRPASGGADGESVAVDPVNGRVYLSLGQSTGTFGGEIFSSPDPSVPGSWKSEKLSQAPGEGSRRADAIAVDRPAGGSPAIIAAVVGSGIWGKVVKGGPGSGTWRQVLVNASFGPNLQISWPRGSRLVYVYDPTTGGLWMSQDYGRTWGAGPIWTKPTVTKITGFIAADPTDPTTVYASTDAGLYKLTDTTGALTVTQVTSVPDPTPGPLVVDPGGRLWVAGRASPSEPTGLWRSADGATTWQALADDYHVNTAPFAWALAVAPDGYQYLALRGNGMILNPTVT